MTSTDVRFDVLLSDGTTASIRPARRGDEAGLTDFHARLSERTRVLRFFGPWRVTADFVERLTHFDGVDACCLVAERDDTIVAVAEYDRVAGHPEAEVAFVIEDAYQGRGLGTLLLEHLAGVARRHGIKRFVADTLAENHRMLQVFKDVGFARQYERSSEVMRVALDIAPTSEAMAAMDERDRVAIRRSMERLLRPRSIAVIGASRQPGRIGHELLRNLVSGGFTGPVYPVNPSTDSVAGIPTWPDVETIGGPVDLAVVAVPAAAVAGVVEACGRKGVGGLVVVSAGFAEMGQDGAASERAMTSLAHGHGMRLIGPNCFGVVNTDPDVSMNATFAREAPARGRIGFGSQSGGLGIAILAEASERGLGLSSFVSMGNKADVSGNDLITWWEADDSTDVVLLYLESFGNPRKFSRIARRVSRTKPIVAVKGGRSAVGARAAASHTAALMSPERAVEALFRRTGVVRVDTLEEMFDVADLLVHQPAPRGPRVGIMGNAGGPGVLAADACAGHGLEVPELSPAVQDGLRAFLADGAGVRNPVDMVASASPAAYGRTLELLLDSDEVDAVIVVSTPPLGTDPDEVAAAVAQVADRGVADKTVVAAFLGAERARALLRGGKRPVPCFTYPETAALALAHAWQYGRWLARPPFEAPVLDGIDPNGARRLVAERPGGEWITGARAMAVLASYGVPAIPTYEVTSAADAARLAAELGGAVAIKASGPLIVHKSDVGGVALGVDGPDAAATAFERMQRTLGPSMTGAVLQPMAEPGVETIAGFVADPAFGPLVLFGLGGTTVELLGDTATRLAPLDELDAQEMLGELHTAPLLTGYRGSPAVDLGGLSSLLLRLGRLAEDLPELVEADCNPVIATPSGVTVVDARFRVSDAPVDEDDALRHLRGEPSVP